MCKKRQLKHSRTACEKSRGFHTFSGVYEHDRAWFATLKSSWNVHRGYRDAFMVSKGCKVVRMHSEGGVLGVFCPGEKAYIRCMAVRSKRSLRRSTPKRLPGCLRWSLGTSAAAQWFMVSAGVLSLVLSYRVKVQLFHVQGWICLLVSIRKWLWRFLGTRHAVDRVDGSFPHCYVGFQHPKVFHLDKVC